MMNLRKKSKKTILSSLIALALSSSMAFAMPQGGTVVAGNVNGVTSGSLANLVSGGTLNVNGSSLIDWNSFSIGQQELLNVVFNSGANMLINHVTGSEISQLLGTLNATQGKGTFMLINPNGIVVGPNATLNVGSLVLSSLNTTDDQLKSVLNVIDTRNENASTNLKWTKGGDIIIKNGAKLSVADTLELYGGRIQIADGVTISNGLQVTRDPSKNKVDAIFLAADEVDHTIKGNGNTGENRIVATSANTITIDKANIVNAGKMFKQNILGGSVILRGTKFGTEQNPISNLNIRAFKEVNRINKDEILAKADATSVIGAKDVVINVASEPESKKDIRSENEWFAGKIMIDNTTANMKNAGASIATVNQLSQKGDSDVSFKSDASNLIMIRGSKIAMKGEDNTNTEGLEEGTVFIVGGQVKIDSSQAEVNNLEINAATNREDGKMFGGDDDRIFYATKDNALVIQDSTAKTTGHALFTGGSVSLLGKNVAEVGEGKSFIIAAGDKVGLKYVEKKEHLKFGEIFGDNLVMANGTVKVSKDTTANREIQISKDPEIYEKKWLEGFHFEVETGNGDKEYFAKDNSFVELDKFFASLKEIATPAQSAVVEKLGSIFNDSTLSDAKKVEKLNEVISQDKEASALMAAVRGQVDNATTAAPQTSTAIPAATSVESTNVAAGEGVMSSDESAVKGVDKKKK